MSCGCGNGPSCSCVLESGDGTTVSGAGSVSQPYVIDGASNVVLSDTVPVIDPPIVNFPGVALDPDTGLPVAYFVPGDGWNAVAGGAGGVEVYRGVGDPNTAIGDPGVSTALYYDLGVPNAATNPVTSTYPYRIWIWRDGSTLWEPYPKQVMASVHAAGSATITTGTWTRLTAASTEVLDTAGMHSTSVNTGRIYAPYDGYYQINGRVAFAAVSGKSVGSRGIRIRRNNTDTIEFSTEFAVQGTGSAPTYPFLYGATFLNAGDWVEVEVFQDSGSNLAVTLGEFTVRLIEPVAPAVGS